jgi:hypothetical protein
VSLIAFLTLLPLATLPLPALAWNIPGHMLSGIIAYQVLQQENPQTIQKVKALGREQKRRRSGQLKFSQNLLSLIVIFFVVN